MSDDSSVFIHLDKAGFEQEFESLKLTDEQWENLSDYMQWVLDDFWQKFLIETVRDVQKGLIIKRE